MHVRLTPPDLSVLIPAHDGAAWLPETLARLPAAAGGLSWETIVVDNASRDESAKVAERTPGLVLLRNDRNLGFSRAVNQAAAVSRGKILAVINQDLHLAPGGLRSVADFLSERDAVAGGALVDPDGRAQRSYGPFPTLPGTLARLALPRELRRYDLRGPAARTTAVDWVTGAFMGFSRALFEKIGGFDEDYFMYYEDVDFCLRARRAGFPSYFLPSARAAHLAPLSSRRDAPDWLLREIRRSQMTFFDKHRPLWERTGIRALNRAYFAARGWSWR